MYQQGQLITQHEHYDRWVHLKCRAKPMLEGNCEICLICRTPIEDGAAVKKLNRGGVRGVRHLACGDLVSSVPFIVDLTDDLEELAPVRNEDLFPSKSGQKRRIKELDDDEEDSGSPSATETYDLTDSSSSSLLSKVIAGVSGSTSSPAPSVEDAMPVVGASTASVVLKNKDPRKNKQQRK
jgi:hypothetical protein